MFLCSDFPSSVTNNEFSGMIAYKMFDFQRYELKFCSIYKNFGLKSSNLKEFPVYTKYISMVIVTTDYSKYSTFYLLRSKGGTLPPFKIAAIAEKAMLYRACILRESGFTFATDLSANTRRF